LRWGWAAILLVAVDLTKDDIDFRKEASRRRRETAEGQVGTGAAPANH
jgi:hypothetical protein